MTGATPACALVITTIHPPTAAVIAVVAGAPRLGAQVILVGDEKSPSSFHQDGAIFLDLAAQRHSGFTLGQLAPTGHYARKNLGYLEAIRRGAEIILETDDDNTPLDAFWTPRKLLAEGVCLRDAGWVNVYRHFTARPIWPRGFPLNRVRQNGVDFAGAPVEALACPIQQGLASGEPDVDALYRLLLDEPADFTAGRTLVLGPGSWCPFNSQNTTWWRDAFPLLYLPSYCSFRMTDIWRSFVAQRIAGANGWGISFTSPTVHQDRNPHDLMRDFSDEIPGYCNNSAIRAALEAVDVQPGLTAIPTALRRCYDSLVAIQCIDADELRLLDAWLADLTMLQREAQPGGS